LKLHRSYEAHFLVSFHINPQKRVGHAQYRQLILELE